MESVIKLIRVMAIGAFLATLSLSSATYTVTTNADAGTGSLRAAIIIGITTNGTNA